MQRKRLGLRSSAPTEAGESVVALVSGDDIAVQAQQAHALIDLTKRAATIDFTGIKARRVLSGAKIEGAIRDYLLIGALLTAAEAVGSTSACLDGIVDYLKTRKQFGKLIGSFQGAKAPDCRYLCGDGAVPVLGLPRLE
jgi:hypothetical protein